MPRALRVCPVPGCPELTRGGRCPDHRAQAEARRGTAAQRGYGHHHRTRFRAGVLRRHPMCVCTERDHRNHVGECLAPSTVADHWPIDRRELVLRGLDPDDPHHGRGLCKACHDQHTSVEQPGGWHAG